MSEENRPSYEERLAAATGYYNKGLRRVKDKPVPKGQKFLPGIFVYVEYYEGSPHAYIRKGDYTMVEYTYEHAFRQHHDDPETVCKHILDYSLLLRWDMNEWGTSAWFDERQLTEVTDEKLIKQFKEELKYQCLKED